MSVPSIPNFVSDAASSTANTTANPRPAAPQAAISTDSVQLTEAQQVYQLYMQGQLVSQIALTLGLPEAVVNSYLNLSPSGT
jgi:DNA-binding NarL/FixJ family response regulator